MVVLIQKHFKFGTQMPVRILLVSLLYLVRSSMACLCTTQQPLGALLIATITHPACKTMDTKNHCTKYSSDDLQGISG